ncbi:prephenate dehydratase [Paraoerskovia marina]|uniref:Prephenate dehydratase n=1 Tax=Paraoerskovia marina TaxID=545619 RepID=A0A1H1UP02_9CELL|nr:prephenate dehydratase domain-containing protein [Paraoerskovia marina]SDS74227.1 prephenate dehydratase [Paraoerskovia marina]
MTSIAYLGPEGTFTHEAARRWAAHRGVLADEPRPLTSVGAVYGAVAAGTHDFGIVAIESTVEGYVVPSLDAIVEARDVVAIDETVLDISFDALVRPDHGTLTEVSAHPHGLAQCQEFVSRTGLQAVPATSNAAACRDAAPHQVALGPSICADLYGLEVHESAVQDYQGARTRFFTLAHRDQALEIARSQGPAPEGWRTVLAITPTVTGPGVLARITAAFAQCGVNMSSVITRPIKARDGWYVFVLTVDAAPWEPGLRAVLTALLAARDGVKTLGVLPTRAEIEHSPSHQHLPRGSAVHSDPEDVLGAALVWGDGE